MMRQNNIRKDSNDKYDGTLLAKQKLLNLYLYTHANIKEFCHCAKNYRDYLVKTLNSIEEDRKKDCLPNYNNISNRILRITEIDNNLTLNRLLFNVLSAFDAFIGYLSLEIKNNTHGELKKMVDNIKPLLTAKTFDTSQDFNLKELLHQARNALIHSGSYICKSTVIPSGAKNMVVPALVIIPSEIFSEQYCQAHNIDKDYCVDAYEVFKKYLEALDNVDIKEIISEK